VGNPVIAKILSHLAGGAACPLSDITVHGRVESIAANNHVQMGGWEGARLGSGVKALGGQGRAWETEAGLGRGDEGGQKPEGWDGIRLHLGGWSYL
jgi:hypothetical protein